MACWWREVHVLCCVGDVLIENEKEFFSESPQHLAATEKEICFHKEKQELETLEVYGLEKAAPRRRAFWRSATLS